MFQEKVCRAKFLQYVSGINLTIFWISSILWDVFTNMSTVLLIVIMLLTSQHHFWSEANIVGIIALLLIGFNFAMMPIVCLASLIFTKPTTGVNVLSFAGLFICKLKDYFTKNCPKNSTSELLKFKNFFRCFSSRYCVRHQHFS